ncbi:recombination-associated protein RdgC [Mariprofundus ferrooxydans]|uniref:Recombination-associated protein RdgC n=1 Tax=Mariprofundus ferrooxydans PV-1 TaxID=314345 RepID=Q0F2D9_9PROT|nr:recombination-associated protein RdgC [Mariprofundus ferrooxydans]EAU55611.1 recombination associated protein [Mariprofundus ferrooxydans PV-1]KON48655.1 recombination associated protein [Mariprofundus ferrooxydans]
MWFRNIQFYRFEEPFKLTGEQLHEQLSKRQSRPCGQMEMASNGWSAPLGKNGTMLVHETAGNLMFCLRREDKVLPASLVRELVDAQIFEIEQAGRTPGRKEKGEIRDQVLAELLPRAFVRASHTFACILPASGWLVINASSARKADEVIEALNKTLTTLPVVMPSTEQSPEAAMTGWLMRAGSLPEDFTFGEECELHDAASSAVVRCRNVDVMSDEVRAHVTEGLTATKLALNWRERISFVLSEDLSVKRMKFDTAIVDEAGDQGGDDEVARFDADFAMMAAEFSEFIPQLLTAVDGA